VLYLIDELKMDTRAIEKLLYQESGLLGVSGVSSDMRTLLASKYWSGTVPLLTGFVAVVFVVGLLIPQIIPKWALFAPVFVPLFMQLGIAPEAVLAAYRVGDSPSNVINPLMPYFALVVTFVQRYQKDAGVGTVIALMLPYAVVMTVVWTLLLIVWLVLGIPFGPG